MNKQFDGHNLSGTSNYPVPNALLQSRNNQPAPAKPSDCLIGHFLLLPCTTECSIKVQSAICFKPGRGSGLGRHICLNRYNDEMISGKYTQLNTDDDINTHDHVTAHHCPCRVC